MYPFFVVKIFFKDVFPQPTRVLFITIFLKGIEETGEGGRIHMSAETATLLIQAAKELWLQKRADKVSAKGLSIHVHGWCASSWHTQKLI